MSYGTTEADEPANALTERIAGLDDGDRFRSVLALVCEHTAALLGVTADDVNPDQAYMEYGYNSMAAVALTSQLSEATGIELPITMLFDYPNPTAVAEYLLSRVRPAVAEIVNPEPLAETDEPIAIVGLGCRFPGGAVSPDGLWDLLVSGGDAVSEFPTDRGWDLDKLFDPDPDQPGTFYCRGGGFLDRVGDFDAGFFGVAPREAVAMDPQHRLLLHGAWETIEHAGIDPTSLRGTPTGVFIGIATQDYAWLARSGSAELEGYWGIGTAGSVASGRLAYSLGLTGPAVSVDTACSSSLVALHLACGALRRGECSLALAGGVTVLATPSLFVEFSRQRALSVDGRCRSFSADAGGTGWAEGMGLVLVERLSDAQRNGHPVLAVIRGSAVNQDGASNGLTAPNGPSQEAVIRAALANAGLAPADIDAVEAHGTGTRLGDPIEAQALLATHGQRDTGNPLWLGSMKSNIGHAQAAAGIGGVIKMTLALRHETLPRTLHSEQPTDAVDWSTGNVALLQHNTPWPRTTRPRRAGISAFGVSGTNAHIVIEEPPAEPERALTQDGITALTLSAKSEAALTEQAGRLSAYLAAHPDLSSADVSYTLAAGRAHLEHRAVVVGADRAELIADLNAVRAGQHSDRVVIGTTNRPGKVAFVFPGQGSQWLGMAVELLDSAPVFAGTLRACSDALAEHVGWSLEGVIRGVPGAPSIERVDVIQPVLFGVMVSLAALWRSYGVEPDAVIGHSQGEIAAACVAGALSISDAARVVALRSKAITGIAGHGGMVSITVPLEALRPRLDRFADRLSVAALNGPASVVVSGEATALAELLEECAADNIWARAIPVDYASHSAHIESIRDELAELLAPISPKPGDIQFQSTVTGVPMDTSALDGDYWYRNLRQTVRFSDGITALLDQGYRTFVEMSPHPILTMAVEQTVEGAGQAPDQIVITGSLRRDHGGLAEFLTALGRVHCGGGTVDWPAAAHGGRLVRLPTYAFQTERYWVRPADDAVGDLRSAGLTGTGHPLLTATVGLADRPGRLFTGVLSAQAQPWLLDHLVGDVVLVAGTVFVELAVYAATQVGCGLVEELVIEKPLVLVEDGTVTIQVSVGEPDSNGRCPVTVHSRLADTDESDVDGWVRHASGTLAPDPDQHSGSSGEHSWPPAAAPMDISDIYDRLADRGLGYGPAFQGLRASWQSGAETFAEVALGDEHRGGARRFTVHPALLDAAFHAKLTGIAGGAATPDTALLPFAWTGIRVHTAGADTVRVRLVDDGPDAVGMTAVDEGGAPVVSVASVAVRPVSLAALAAAGSAGTQCLFGMDWVPVPLPAGPPSLRIAVLGELAIADTDLLRYQDFAEFAAALDAGAVPPDVLVVAEPDRPAEPIPAATRRITGWALDLVRGWLGEPRCAQARLAFLTRDAVPTPDVRTPDLVAAPLWGLVRSAQSEHPDRFALIDIDADPASANALPGALAAGESQLIVRAGACSAPRVSRRRAQDADRVALNPAGTVLITGGTSGLGALLARHLVTVHGVRHLMLASRRGSASRAATELAEELTGLGAEVHLAACDVGDRDALAAMLDSVPAEHPLTAVIHSAGVLDDGLVESLTAEQIDRVLRPKVDAAVYLDELTERLELDAFVLFSSVAGIIGGPGQGNYAAGNAFLDALAAHRGARGLAATSIAWGLWEQASAMTGHLSGSDMSRLRGSGLAALSTEDGLALFDTALAMGDPVAIAARLDTSALRAQARSGVLAPILRGLAGTAIHRTAEAGGSLVARLAGVAEADRAGVVRQLVLGQVAAVLGHDSAGAVDPDRPFKELGFDSLAAVQLRNRLNRTTGLNLPSTTVFDHPTANAVADHLLAEVDRGATEQGNAALDGELDRLATLVSSVAASDLGRIAARLRALAGELDRDASLDGVAEDLIHSASAEEIFDLIDNDLEVR